MAQGLKASACNAADLGLIPGLGRSPGEGNGNPLQYSCLENPMDRGAWWATVHGVAKSGTWLSNFTFTFKSKRPGSKGCIVYNYMHMTFWKRQSYRNIEQINGYQELKGEVSFVYYNRFYLICGGRGLEEMKLFCFFIVMVIIQLCFCQIS